MYWYSIQQVSWVTSDFASLSSLEKQEVNLIINTHMHVPVLVVSCATAALPY